jgi:hypothetical protein
LWPKGENSLRRFGLNMLLKSAPEENKMFKSKKKKILIRIRSAS